MDVSGRKTLRGYVDSLIQIFENCRTGLSNEAFDALVARVVSRADDVPVSIARLAKAARIANVRMLSHDDNSPDMRQAFRAHGVDAGRIISKGYGESKPLDTSGTDAARAKNRRVQFVIAETAK